MKKLFSKALLSEVEKIVFLKDRWLIEIVFSEMLLIDTSTTVKISPLSAEWLWIMFVINNEYIIFKTFYTDIAILNTLKAVETKMISGGKQREHWEKIDWFGTHSVQHSSCYPTNIYFFKINNRNAIKKCEICSKVTIKTPEQHQRRHSVVFIVNFQDIAHLF